MSDNTFYLTLGVLATVGIATIACFGIHEAETTKREAIKAGLHETASPEGTIWTKP